MNIKTYIEVSLKCPTAIPKIFIVKIKKRLYSYLNRKNLIVYQRQYKSIDDSVNLFWFSSLKINNKNLIKEKDIKHILEDAEKIIKGQLDYLDIYMAPNNIEWKRDYKTGYLWKDVSYQRLNVYNKPLDVDVKTVWDLNRMHHLVRLAQAWVITGEEKYIKRILCDVKTWIDDNPVGYGVNWANAMEVAIRASNIAVAYYLIKESLIITDDFKNKIYFLMESHGKYIFNNLEWFPGKNGNHYLADLCGLIYISVLFPNIKNSRKWFSFAIKELEKEIILQVLPDGANFEASISYHKLVLEMLMFTYALLISNNYFVPRVIEDKIKAMVKFTEGYIKGDGNAPQIGDNDSGHFLMLFPRSSLDHSYLIDIASILFDDCLPFGKGNRYKEVFWINPKKDIFFEVKRNEKSVAFKETGIYVMKGKNIYCAISCGSVGQRGNGGHSHNDKLSIELSIDDKDFIVDPGTYVYTSNIDWRNYFRSTAVHNTLTINNSEQNNFVYNNIFRLDDQTNCKCSLWESTDEYDKFSGYHSGYLERFNLIHYRSIFHNKRNGKLYFRDRIKNLGEGKEYEIRLNLTFHPLVKVYSISSNAIELINGNTIVGITFQSSNAFKLNLNDCWYSPKYGKKFITKSLSLITRHNKDSYIDWKVEKKNNA
jgi:Heparinase II/III-like protein/Heparinase II/III N-terminus